MEAEPGKRVSETAEARAAAHDGSFQLDGEATTAHLKREMTSRHLQFIAIGGTIGTGLYLGSGKALAIAGPVGCLLGFMFMGCIAFSTMASLGEMATFIPVPGSFTSYAARFVDPSLGFALGWIYWFSWATTFALELTAAGLIIQYWNQTLNIGIFIAVFWAVFTAANFLPIRWYGELEMWFSSIKVVTIVGFVIFALCVNVGVGTQGYLGFRYWMNPGPFVEYKVQGTAGKFIGVWAVLITASFSYQGVEVVGLGAGEARNPHKTVPVAIRNTFWGVALLFVATVFFIGITVPSNDENLMSAGKTASASPLVITAARAGIPVLPHIINAVLVSAALSVANSCVYSGSRTLVALVNEGSAPKILTRTNKQGVPYFAVAFTAIFGLLGFINLSTSGGVAFNWLMNTTAVAGVITWMCIQICHVRFMAAMRAQGVARSSLPYLAPFQPYLTWFGLFFNTLIMITSGFTVFFDWSMSDFISSYISVFIFGLLFVGHKLIRRTRALGAAEVDLARGRMSGGLEHHDAELEARALAADKADYPRSKC